MARRGWSTANFLRLGSAVATAAPLSMACWAKTSIASATQQLVGLFVGTTNFNQFRIVAASTNTVNANTTDGAASSSAVTSTNYPTNTWFHAAGVWASATSRAAYLNGGGKGTETTSRTPTGINRTSIGVSDGSTIANPFAPAGTGDIAEVAIWNVALTDDEVFLLSRGFSPLMVRPNNLVAYWPLIGRASPEINVLDRAAVQTVQGALTASEHPRVFMPQRIVVPFSNIVAAEVQPPRSMHQFRQRAA